MELRVPLILRRTRSSISGMVSIDKLRLLGDQVLVRRLATMDREGMIWIPETAQQARKIHQGGGDYLFKGEVLKCGPGDKGALLTCDNCRVQTERFPRRAVPDSNVFVFGKCHECGGALTQFFYDQGSPWVVRAPMPVKVGDIILYENRAQAQLHPTRFPSIDDEGLVILLCEQHVLAVLEDEAVAA